MSSRLSLSGIIGTHSGSCGYCKGARSIASSSSSSSSSVPSSGGGDSVSEAEAAGSVSYGLSFTSLTPSHYQSLLDQGWRRSGSYCYLPDNFKTCCPAHTIRLHCGRFNSNKRQRKVERRFREWTSSTTTKDGVVDVDGEEQDRRDTDDDDDETEDTTGKTNKGKGSGKKGGSNKNKNSNRADERRAADGETAGGGDSELCSALAAFLKDAVEGVVSEELLAAAAASSSSSTTTTLLCKVVRSKRVPPHSSAAGSHAGGSSSSDDADGDDAGRHAVFSSSYLVSLACRSRGKGPSSDSDSSSSPSSPLSLSSLSSAVSARLAAASFTPGGRSSSSSSSSSSGSTYADPLAEVGASAMTDGAKVDAPRLLKVKVDETSGYVNFYVKLPRKTDCEKRAAVAVASAAATRRKKATTAVATPAPSPASFTARLIPSLVSLSSPEVHRLYASYQSSVHGDVDPYAPSSSPTSASLAKAKKSFQRFLCDSPLVPPAPAKTEDMPQPDADGYDVHAPYGTYHLQYRLSGVLVAVGVVDVLPSCLSSVYCFYDVGVSKNFNLGTFTALHEIEWVRRASAHRPNLQYYYMGYYIHSCGKMRYKADFSPSELRCPVTGVWVDANTGAVPMLGEVDGRGVERFAPQTTASTSTSTADGDAVAAPSSKEEETVSQRRKKTGKALVGALALDLGPKRGGVVPFRTINDEARNQLGGHLEEFAGNVGKDVALNCFIDA